MEGSFVEFEDFQMDLLQNDVVHLVFNIFNILTRIIPTSGEIMHMEEIAVDLRMMKRKRANERKEQGESESHKIQ